jgi:ribosome-associated protein
MDTLNKVATAVQMRVDVTALGLPPSVYRRLKGLAGSKWIEGGAILVTARSHRTREANREDARARVGALIAKAFVRPERRIKTKPTKASKERRLTAKSTRSGVKAGRGRPALD